MKKTISIIAIFAIVLTAGFFAKNYFMKGDCCKEGAACCKVQSACCDVK